MEQTDDADWRARLRGFDEAGDAEAALAMLRGEAFRRPSDAELQFETAERLRARGRLTDAATIFALAAVSNDPGIRSRALLRQAECLKDSGALAAAEVALRAASSCDRSSHWPIIHLAGILERTERFVEARELIEASFDGIWHGGRSEAARFFAGMLARRHFAATRPEPGWGPRAVGAVPGLSRAGLIMMVKDEADIVAANLSHHYEIGFRIFCVLDNGSVDGTRQEIERFSRNRPDALVMVVTDPITGYYQAAKMALFGKTLVEYATIADRRVDWLFYLDADEFLACCRDPDGAAIAAFDEALADPGIDVLVMHWVHAASRLPYETLPAGYDPFRAFDKMTARLEPTVPKVALRTGHDFVPMMGNHFVAGYSGPLSGFRTLALDDWYLLHYPLRSVDHVRKKVINGGRAFRDSKGLEQHGGHWRERYALYERHGDGIIRQILQNGITEISEEL